MTDVHLIGFAFLHEQLLFLMKISPLSLQGNLCNHNTHTYIHVQLK